jgi:chromosome segregation ATPase
LTQQDHIDELEQEISNLNTHLKE